MSILSEEQCSGLAIDHLGLVADKIEDLEIISMIDERLSLKEGCGSKTTLGERVAAMILNGLGFVDGRLYVFSEFLEKRPVSRLFGKPMKAEWFNDDALGRCLDRISAYGTTKLFTELSFSIGIRKGLLGKSAHFDTTTLQLYGQYSPNSEASDSKIIDEVSEIPIPARGYSKSHRMDLKQMVLNLATTGKAAFPIWMESHSGNVADKKVLPEAASRMNALCKQLEGVDDFMYVGDSAMYSNVLPFSNDFKWLSRAPNNISAAKKLLLSADDELQWQDLEDGYSYYVKEVTYKEVQQRWVMIRSEQAYQREVKTLRRNIDKELTALKKEWWHLSNQVFSCAKDAEKAAKKLAKKMKYQKVQYKAVEQVGYAKAGRPSKASEVEVKGYQITFALSEAHDVIEKVKSTKGRFILATNELDKERLSDAGLLSEYKAQSGTERGFKFIKDDSFQIDSVFLKTPERIDALMMIMTLCLMVYGVSQYELHQSLAKANETVPNQLRKPTQRPSLKWVYFLFSGVHELTVKLGSSSQQLVINVNAVLKRIVAHFGTRAQAIYLNPT